MMLPTAVIDSLPVWERLLLPVLNRVGQRSEFRITVTAPDYVRVEILWGFFCFEKGEKREFCVRGTPAYVNAICRGFQVRGLQTHNRFVG